MKEMEKNLKGTIYHSAHVSKETRLYLSSVSNRFDFIFAPKHGSWLNIIESFYKNDQNISTRNSSKRHRLIKRKDNELGW
jgi:hypothetical protein